MALFSQGRHKGTSPVYHISWLCPTWLREATSEMFCAIGVHTHCLFSARFDGRLQGAAHLSTRPVQHNNGPLARVREVVGRRAEQKLRQHALSMRAHDHRPRLLLLCYLTDPLACMHTQAACCTGDSCRRSRYIKAEQSERVHLCQHHIENRLEIGNGIRA
jgi:hypothetical protein